MSVSIRRLGFVALLALPWLWPFTSGPTAGVQPYLVSLACAALLLALWPAGADQDRVADAVAAGWCAAALLSAVIALLQYFSLEGPLYPWVNGSGNARAFGNLRQPNQLATLLMIGLLALRLLEQRGRVAGRWPLQLRLPRPERHSLPEHRFPAVLPAAPECRSASPSRYRQGYGAPAHA